MIINLTPHSIRVYGWNVPDRIQVDGEHEPLQVFEPSNQVARLVELEIGGWTIPGMPFPIQRVEYGQATGLPATHRDSMDWYIVSLVVALALPHRPDLLAPYREVRNLDGVVIGCRSLVRPV